MRRVRKTGACIENLCTEKKLGELHCGDHMYSWASGNPVANDNKGRLIIVIKNK